MRNNEIKTIGIYTFSNTLDNYGQVLQYLATQEYLEMRGCLPFLYVPQGHKVSLWKRLKRQIRRIVKKSLGLFLSSKKESFASIKKTMQLSLDEQKQLMFQRWSEVTQMMEEEHPRHFAEFRKKYFHTRSCYYEDLDEIYAFAIGSDQMWSYISADTMLDFAKDGVRRFSIAPSVGHKEFSAEEIDQATPSLAKFDFITVREQNGLDFCRACGRDDAHLVLDPTFLIPQLSYQKYADLQGLKVPKKYVMIYLLGGEIELPVADIFRWAEDNGLEVVYVASQGRDDDYPKCYATVEQWLAILQNAEYVFTNSFHGMALSIIYRKSFLTFPLAGLMKGMNGRITQLAENFKLNERIYNGDLNLVMKPISWEIADNAIEKNMNKLGKLLKTIDL